MSVPATATRRPPAGRDLELSTARSLVLGDTHGRGVQLTGPGGIGKTTIARRLVAELHADERPCAVIERHLHPVLVVNRVARALPHRSAWLRRATDDTERIARLSATICDEPVIVVFDGLDRQLATASGALRDRGTRELVTRLVRAAEVGTGRVIVTSRSPIDDLTGVLPVLPLTPLSGTELDELLATRPRVRSQLDDLTFAIRQVIGGYPRLTELADAAIRLGRPARRRLRNELGQEVDLAPAMLRDRILRVIVDRLDDRTWELLAHLALVHRPITTAQLADALGTPARDEVGRVARQLAAIGVIRAAGRDLWLPDAWTAAGLRALESDPGTVATRHLRLAAAHHTPGRAGVGLDDAEDAVRHLVAAGASELAAERGLQLAELLLVDGQTHRAVAVLSELWDGLPVGEPCREDVGAFLRRTTSLLDGDAGRATPPAPDAPVAPMRLDADEAETTGAEPVAAVPEADAEPPAVPEADAAADAEQAARADAEHEAGAATSEARQPPAPVPTEARIDLRDDPEVLLAQAERLAAIAEDEPHRWDEIEELVERLEGLALDEPQTGRLLDLLSRAASASA